MLSKHVWVVSSALVAGSFAAFSPRASAQVQVFDSLGYDEGVVVQDGMPEMPQPDGAPGAPNAKAKPTPRQEKLSKLEYDRRPSTILKVWSTPPKPPGAKDETSATTSGPPPASESIGAPPASEAAPTSVIVAGATPVSATSSASTPAVVLVPAVRAGTTSVAVTATVAAGATSASSQPGVAASTTAPAPADPSGASGAPDVASSAGATDADAAEKQRLAAEKAAAEAARKTAEAKAIEAECAALQRNVTLGDWPAVKGYLATLTKEEATAAYARILESLQKGPSQRPNVPPQGNAFVEKNRFEASDVLGLALAAPLQAGDVDKKQLAVLGQILRQSLDAGAQLDVFLVLARVPLGAPDSPIDARKLARVLAAANELVAIGEFLPSADEAEQKNDREGLNLLSRHYLAQNDKDKKLEWLEKAWRVTQAALAAGEVSEEEKDEALRRAVDVAPRIQKELGQKWLDESFTSRPERGMEILAAIGTSASTSLAAQPMSADLRLKWLQLQSTATKALLAAAPERADEWKATLSLLAGNWLKEALFSYQWDTSTSMNPSRQRDRYGNFYYWDPSNYQRGNMPTPIKVGEVLEARPDDGWLAHVEVSLRPKFDQAFAQLFLKVGEETRAFPYIESLAAAHPKPAKELVDEFLRVWSKNHNPNDQNANRNQYVYFYGFEERANGIPLTRSKQERNLAELGGWIERLRKLPVEVDQNLLMGAFVSSHSQAEVFRLETIEDVFGPVAKLEPATLGALVQSMRANLLTVWRDPAVQDQKKTKRKQKDIEAEVVRGYQLAQATVEKALADHAGSWELLLAKAELLHDENNFRWELSKDPEFSARRAQAFELFHGAADAYAKALETLDREKETTQVYDAWFYAALGASDLAAITHEQTLAPAEIPLIHAAIEGLAGERAKRHMDMFASALFTRMSSAKPAVKFRYVREGLAITGDHELAREAKDVFDYYKDLVTEIQLAATIDGTDRVGSTTPFGLRVDLVHTTEIERESGGFSKYLQNQNSGAFSFNYGRPTEDYREKFEEATRAALTEHFEVLSITFSDPAVKSKPTDKFGWRTTPYAYVLLKPRGPEVDRVPSLRLDLDFLDTSGYAVLPIESPTLVIDASKAEERPFERVKLVQTLDERQAKDGKLLLEIKATSIGIAPPFESLVELAPSGFEVAKREDPGPSVVKFDDEGDDRQIVCERLWTLTLKAKEGAPRPDAFTFAKPKVDLASNEHFRYVDADLASVGDTIALEREYEKPSRSWMWWGPLALLALGAGFVVARKQRKPKSETTARFRVPDEVTPFTVIGLLRDIERNDGLAPDVRAELAGEIGRLEQHYFAEPDPKEPDLEQIARSWASRAR